MVKAKFGDGLRSKTLNGQLTEAMALWAGFVNRGLT